MLKTEFSVLWLLLGAPRFLRVLRFTAQGQVLLLERMRSGKREGRVAFLRVLEGLFLLFLWIIESIAQGLSAKNANT